jgi:glycosyltransferase involved in cell wall biosynthesis
MRIVLVTHYYPPEVNAPAQRACDHARIWRDEGHEVTVVTAQPSHPYGRLYDGYDNRTEVSTTDGIRVVRLKTLLGANAGQVRRSLNYLSFMLAVQRNVARVGKADVVISTSPQFLCGLSGETIAKRTGAPWVLEVRDIWPESIVAVGASRPSAMTRSLTTLADRAYRRCDLIVSASPGFADHFGARGVPEDKVALVPNGSDTAAVPAPATFDDFPELAPIAGRFIAAYIGTFGMAHNLATLLEAAELLKDDPRIGILLVGSGAERDALVETCDDRKFGNVVILDQQPRERIRQLYSLCAANIVHLKKQEVFRTVIPTKLLEAMAMGKPVLLGVQGIARQILETAEAGLTFEPENADELAGAIRELAENPARATRLGMAGARFARKEYDREVMARRYLDRLQNLVEARQGAH